MVGEGEVLEIMVRLAFVFLVFLIRDNGRNRHSLRNENSYLQHTGGYTNSFVHVQQS